MKQHPELIIFDGQSNCKHIQLTHYPVISVTLFRDNQRDSNYTDLVEDTDFAVDKEAGIIELIRDDWNILKGSTSLTVGTKTVKITYTWGYESIPDSISIFADSMLAWIVETKESIDNMKTSNGAILSKVNIGDYAEAYSTNNKQIDGKYKDILGSLTEHLIQRYKFWGESGNYHVSL